MTISPCSPFGTRQPRESSTRACTPDGLPTLPIFLSLEEYGLLNAGAAVSVRPMVSMTPIPNLLSNAFRCPGERAEDAERQKRTRQIGRAACRERVCQEV